MRCRPSTLAKPLLGAAACHLAAALVLAHSSPAIAAPAVAADDVTPPDATVEPDVDSEEAAPEKPEEAPPTAPDDVTPADATAESDVDSEKAAPARAELPPAMDLPVPPPWQRLLELGAGAAYVARPLFHERRAEAASYGPGVGFTIQLHWDLLSFLRFSPYFYNVSQPLTLPAGSLSAEQGDTVSRGATFSDTSTASFAFGARLDPTLWLNERLRLWLTAGVGWGRMHIPEIAVTDPVGGSFSIGERSSVFVEFPLGVGVAVDIIERWLALEYQTVATPLSGQSGTALDHVQAVDGTGRLLDIGPLEELDVTFVHTLALSLIL